MRIMLIDDSATMRSIQRAILTQLGPIEIFEAADGHAALAAVDVFKPELVLCNWNMPGMNGLTFVRTFRQQNSRTPVIMCTSEADKSSVVEAVKAGVNNYIVKPFTPDVLLQRVTETLAAVCAST